jgi:predicted ribonuclease YlaK
MPHEVKTIITPAGEGTKIVLTGDIHQIDHPYLDSLSNGLSYLINRMRASQSTPTSLWKKGNAPNSRASYCRPGERGA